MWSDPYVCCLVVTLVTYSCGVNAFSAYFSLRGCCLHARRSIAVNATLLRAALANGLYRSMFFVAILLKQPPPRSNLFRNSDMGMNKTRLFLKIYTGARRLVSPTPGDRFFWNKVFCRFHVPLLLLLLLLLWNPSVQLEFLSSNHAAFQLW